MPLQAINVWSDFINNFQGFLDNIPLIFSEEDGKKIGKFLPQLNKKLNKLKQKSLLKKELDQDLTRFLLGLEMIKKAEGKCISALPANKTLRAYL